MAADPAGTGAGRDRGLTAPANVISLARIPLAGLYLLASTRTARIVIIVLAAASDYADGWVARRFGSATRLGELLDPITDKAFLVTAIVAHYLAGELAGWQLALLLVRDAYSALAFGIATALRLPVRFRARFSGKVVTSLQLLAVLVLALLPAGVPWVVGATAAAAVWAIIDYTVAGAAGLRRASGSG